MRGLAYSTQGQFAKAIEDYNKAIALCPDDPESYCSLYSGRGHVWQLLDEHKSAIEDFNNAIAAMSDSDSIIQEETAILHSANTTKQ